MKDDGLQEIQELIRAIGHGDFTITGKMFNHQVAKIEIPYSQKYKLDFTRAASYFIDKLKEAQVKGLDITFNLTVDVKPNGDIYLIENGFTERAFKVQP